jgi:hypothetical protein
MHHRDKANTYSSATGGPHRILMEDAMRGLHGQRNAGDQPLPAFPAGRMSIRHLAQLKARQQIQDSSTATKSHLTEHDQGPRQGTTGQRSWSVWRRSSDHTHAIPLNNRPARHSVRGREPTNLALLAYDPSQMLCQMSLSTQPQR